MPPRKYTAENNRIARARFAKESRDPKRDIARKAKMAKSIDDYDPRRNDWKGVDTPGSKAPRKSGTRRKPRSKAEKFSAAAAWRAHVMETHKQMGGSLKDAMRAASKTWIKKGGDPFTNFMAAGGTGGAESEKTPPYAADGWKGELYQDKTGTMWQSLPDESGVYHWVKSSAPVTAPLPAIPAQYKAKPLPSIPVAYGPAKKPLPAIPAPVSVPLPSIPDDDERLPIGTPAEQAAAAADAEEVEEEFYDANDDETFQGQLPPIPSEEETAEEMGELPLPPLPIPPAPAPPVSVPLPPLPMTPAERQKKKEEERLRLMAAASAANRANHEARIRREFEYFAADQPRLQAKLNAMRANGQLAPLPAQPSAPPMDDNDAINEEEDLSDLNFPPVPRGDYDADEDYIGYLSQADPIRLQASEVEPPVSLPFLPRIFAPFERLKKNLF